jgi:Holliday junction resolvase RusA-like endonuclease
MYRIARQPFCRKQPPATIIIDGPAVAKGRPRMARRGIAYTPTATRRYEAHRRLVAQLAMHGRPPISVAVKLTTVVELPIPTSWSGKRRAAAIAGDIRPTTRPDIDNFLIVELDARKRYSIAPPLTALPATRRAAS